MSDNQGLKRIFKPEEGWLVFLLLVIISLTTTSTVEDAKWVREMPSLAPMALLALLTGYVLSRVRVPALLLHPVGGFIGLLVIVWQTANAASGDSFGARLADASYRLSEFMRVLQGGGISVDGLPFAVQVLFFTWIVGYLSAWFLFRHHNAWLAVVPPGVALLVNLTYLPGRFGGHFLIWVLSALLLVMLMHSVELRRRWRREGVAEHEMEGSTAAVPIMAVAGGILALSFWSPVVEQSLPITVFWENVTGPWRGVEREFDRLFASVSSGRVAPLHTFGRSMPFRGAVNFGDQNPIAGRLGIARDVVMNVQADEPGYWRAESYDSYSGHGWTTSERVTKALAQDPVPGTSEAYNERKLFNHTVELNLPMDVLFARGMALYGTALSNGEMARPAGYSLNIMDASKNRGLPQDIQGLARDLAVNLPRIADRNEIQRRIPEPYQLRVDRPTMRGGQIEAVEVRRTEPFPPDFSSVRPLSTLPRGHKYSLTSSISTASIETLQKAGTDYPGWVRDQYLQVPERLPGRVRSIAREWTQDSQNPYDRAWAIETRLRDIKYSTNIPPPPRDADGVDYFIFNLNRGYADYYASAMAVLLRTLGIPSRVAVGYVAGEWDTDKEYYVVRETHAHAWTEVFFPGYGWIEFNPSPNWPTVPRAFSSTPNPNNFEDEDDFDFGMEDFDDESMGDPGAMDIPADGAGIPQFLLILGAVVAGGAGLFGLLRFEWLRGLARLTFAAQTYEKMCRLALLARLSPRQSGTPWEYARALSARVPEAAPSIRTITGGYTRSVYGNQEMGTDERQGLDRAWREVRGRLLKRFFKRGR